MIARSAKFWLAVLCLLAPAALRAEDSPPLPVRIAPDNEDIRYTGRFDTRDAKACVFGWSGCQIQVRFEGTALNMLMRDSASGRPSKVRGTNNNYFNVIVDGKEPVVLGLEKDRTVYRIADDLPAGDHTVTIFRRTEPLWGEVTFLGLQLPAGASLKPLPPRPERRIEFIGDSITAGYGNEGTGPKENFCPFTQNNYLAYGAVTARKLNAEYLCFAWSGEGVYRNRSEKTDRVLPILYTRTLPRRADGAWEFKGPKADVVVINLCTNDFAFTIPEQEPFTKAYLGLIATIRKNHPAAHIFCCVGPMMGDTRPNGKPGLSTVRRYLTEMVEALGKEGEAKVHYFEFAPQDHRNGLGSSYHPSVKTHGIMAEALTEAIRKTMDW